MRNAPRFVASALTLLGLCLPLAVRAEPAEEVPETEVVVTATRRAQPKRASSAATTVITRADILASGAPTVAEALRSAPGVDIPRYGSLGSLAMPSMRGSSAGQVLVLVDGRRANNPQTGIGDLTDIPIENVERIEVVHGGASALYGSDAIGGVINVITRRGRGGDERRLVQSYGSFDTQLLSGRTAGSSGRVRYALSGQRVTSGGDFGYWDPVAGRHLDRINGGYRFWDLSGEVSSDLGNGRRLTLSTEYGDADKNLPGSLSYPTAQAEQRDRRLLMDLQYQMPLGEAADLSARLYRVGSRQTYTDPASYPTATDALHRATTDVAELLGHARMAGAQTLTYGYEFRNERVRSNSIGRQRQEVHAVYAQDQIAIGRLQVIPGARVDMATGYTAELSPKLGLLYRLSDAWAVRGNVGRAFRSPGLNDRFWPEDPFTRGNANLRPERALTADLGAAWTPTPTVEVEATAFVHRISDLIVWQPGVLAPGKWSPTNVGKARVAGIETAASWRTGERLSLRASLTYQDARDRSGAATTDGKRLLLRPDWLANVGTRWRLGRGTAGLDLRYTGRRAADRANDHFLGRALVTDVRLDLPVGARVTAGLQVTNLFDKRYETQPGYPMPGRTISFRLAEEW